MNKRKLLTFFFFLVCIGLAFYLIRSIKTRYVDQKYVKEIEGKVKQKLLAIRDAEVAYLSHHGSYTDDWEALEVFVNTGEFHIIEITEHIKTLSYGADSVWTTSDTLGTISVKDSLFNAPRFRSIDLSNLSALPQDSALDFELFTADLEGVQVFEVIDISPVNKDRIRGDLPLLKIGSRIKASTKGNWEK